MSFIPLCVPELGPQELEYLRDCVETNWVSYAGTYVTRLEMMMADYVGTSHGVATQSGTSALHVALLVAGIQPGDEVLVSGLTFVAPANTVRYCGAYPTFIDVEREYWQMDVQKLKDFLVNECDAQLVNRNTGRRVRAIIPVHILGHAVDMDPLLELARHYGLTVIEDASESLGGEYRGKRLGSLADIACFSYNGNKIITTGGGGMITTNHAAWAERAKYLTTQARDDAEEYVHGSIGYNYRMTNLQAAVGVAQMERLDEFVARKRLIADRYARQLPCEVMREAPWAFSTYWQYTALVDKDRRMLAKGLADEGIQTRPLWVPLHELTPFADCYAYRCEVVSELHRRAISIPCSTGLTQDDQDRVIAALQRLL